MFIAYATACELDGNGWQLIDSDKIANNLPANQSFVVSGDVPHLLQQMQGENILTLSNGMHKVTKDFTNTKLSGGE